MPTQPTLGCSALVGLDVERQSVLKGTTNQILAALDKLPSDERQAIVTAFDGQCSYREVARILGESERAVKLRIRSGLRRLARFNEALSLPRATSVGDT